MQPKEIPGKKDVRPLQDMSVLEDTDTTGGVSREDREHVILTRRFLRKLDIRLIAATLSPLTTSLYI
jgi:hypothetical protein